MRRSDNPFLILVCGDDRLWTAAIRVAVGRSPVAAAIRVVATGAARQYRRWVVDHCGLVALPVDPQSLRQALPIVAQVRHREERFQPIALLESAWPDAAQRACEQAAWEAGIALSVRGRRNSHHLAHLATQMIAACR